jgi:hypothetical protein
MAAQRRSLFPTGCFFSVFLLVGLLALVFITWFMIVPVWRAATVYVETECTILAKQLHRTKDQRRPGDHRPRGDSYRPEFHIRYVVDGKEYKTWTYDAAKISTNIYAHNQAILDQFKVGGTYPCWYDPEDPTQAVLTRDIGWLTPIFGLIPLVFIGVGIAGLLFGRRLAPEGPAPGESAPKAASMMKPVDSVAPGQDLPVALKTDSKPGCFFFGALVFTVFWNGIVSIFVGQVISDLQRGVWNWFLIVFLTPFVLVGLVAVLVTLYALLLWFASRLAGRLRLELSGHPLTPGQSYDWLLAQSGGGARIQGLTMALVCNEAATYRQGTSNTTDRKEVYKLTLVEGSADTTADPTMGHHGTLTLPLAAMPSFLSEHNVVEWKLSVQGSVLGFLPFSSDFPIEVQPPPHAAPAEPTTWTNEGDIPLEFDHVDRLYQPGEEVTGIYQLVSQDDLNGTKVTFRAGWHTDGKGDRDEGVVHEESWEAGRTGPGVDGPREFRFKLPAEGPVTYYGHNIKIHWTVKVEATIPFRGKVSVIAPFRVGGAALLATP